MKARLLALLTALLLLGGCAFSSQGDDSDDAGASEGPVTLNFVSLAFQDATVQAVEKIVADWNAANPDVQVEISQDSFDTIHDKLVTQFQSGSAPDVIHYEASYLTGFAQQGFLADLGDKLDPEIRQDVSPKVWESVTNDGKTIAAPLMTQTYVAIANTKLLREAGVQVPAGETLSWDQLRATAKQLTKDGRYGLGWGLKQPVATMMSMSPNFGGKFFTGEGTQSDIQVGAAELEVPERIHEMAYTDKSIDPTTLTQSGTDILPGFFDGRYAMIVAAGYLARQIVEQAPEGFEWQVLPALSGVTADQASAPQTLSVAAESDHVEQAAEFVNHVMRPENLAALAEGDALIPTSAKARQAVLENTGGKDGWEQYLATGEHIVTAPYQKVDAYPQWKDQIATPALQEYLANRIDLDTFTKRLTDGWAQVSG